MQEKLFNKIHHTLMTKILNKPGIEGKFPKLSKGIYEKPTTNTTLHDESLKAFSLNSEQDKDAPLTISIQYCVESVSQSNEARKGKKDI